jgi:hypothetical protein
MRTRALGSPKRFPWDLSEAIPQRFALVIGIVLVLTCGSPLAAPIWTNPGTGSWFGPTNWDTLTVPGAGSNPVISNGGTATLSGIASTPQLGSLSIGISSSDTGVGTVLSDSVTMLGGGVYVGTVFSPGAMANGTLNITGAGALLGNGGGLTLAGGTSTFIGTTVVGPDRNGGAFNTAHGTVTIDGTLTIAGPQNFFGIGQTNGGLVSGALSVGTLDMGANLIPSLGIGTSGANGQASGSLTAGGGDLRVGSLSVGTTNSGIADGYLQLSGADLSADNVSAGVGTGGTANIRLTNSDADVAGSFTLLGGQLVLERSLLSVGGLFTLGDGATLQIDVEGMLRGVQYGAIDANQAALNDILSVDFTNFEPFGNTMVFDLLRSGSADGIFDDFNSFMFTGLQSGYSVFAGIELDGVEVYRLRVTQQEPIPEPSMVVLLVSGMGAMVSLRRMRKMLRGK